MNERPARRPAPRWRRRETAFAEALGGLARVLLDCGAVRDEAHRCRLVALADPEAAARATRDAWAELSAGGSA